MDRRSITSALATTRWLVAPALLGAAVGCASDRNLFDQIKTDSWAQAPTNQVDILWVVDNSNSMAEEQQLLVDGFSTFASQLDESDTDFQLGVITTSFPYGDPSSGRLIGDPPYLTQDDADYEGAFAARAAVGLLGNDKEKGYEAATFAVHPSMTLDGAPNAGFVRKDSALLVVFVSDEEDCSDGGALEGQPPTACYEQPDALEPVQGFVDDLLDLKSGQTLVQIGAIVGTDGSNCADSYPGRRYMAGALLTGGLIGDICQSDWSGMMGDLGLNATGIHTRFQTTSAAKPETLEVYVDEDPVTGDPVNGWTYDTATWFLEFHGDAIPPRGSAVTATYTVQPGVPAPVATTGT